MKHNHPLILVATIFGLTILALVAIRELNIYYPIRITNVNASDFVITGEGSVEVVPDTAYLDIGITVSNEPSAQSARDKINETNNRIVEAATQNGIDQADIKTSNYNISPREQFNREEGPVSTTFFGNASITIKTSDLDKAEQLTQILTQAGANNVNVRLGVDDPNRYREEARNKAIENAKAQADKLSKTLGIRLGKITNAVEGGNPNPPIMFQDHAMKAEGLGSASVPDFEPGTQTIYTTITLHFEKL